MAKKDWKKTQHTMYWQNRKRSDYVEILPTKIPKGYSVNIRGKYSKIRTYVQVRTKSKALKFAKAYMRKH